MLNVATHNQTLTQQDTFQLLIYKITSPFNQFQSSTWSNLFRVAFQEACSHSSL